jgi:hypothetical protein
LTGQIRRNQPFFAPPLTFDPAYHEDDLGRPLLALILNWSALRKPGIPSVEVRRAQIFANGNGLNQV